MSDAGDQRDPVLELSAFDRHYGLELVECTDEVVRGRVQVEEHLTQPLGLVHGGVPLRSPRGSRPSGPNYGVAADGMVGLGMSNDSSFLRPVESGTIHGTARRRHRGRTTWVWDVELADDEGRLCALSRVTVAVRPGP